MMASEPQTPSASSDTAPLHTEIARLNKVIRVLIERAERSTNVQGSDFNLFQTTLMLEQQVSERTAALRTALAENEKINRALLQSKLILEETQAEQRALIEELKAAQARLLASESELRRHRDHLSDLVAEQTTDLLHAKEMAECANTLKSEFLANMSHEFRTPLHAVSSYAALGVARADKFPPEKIAAYFSHIEHSAQRLAGLVEDLFDLARLEAHEIHVRLEDKDLVELLTQVEREQMALLDARGISIEMTVSSRYRHAMIDHARIVQVVRIIYSNAIKYSPTGSRIDVSLDSSPPDEAGHAMLCLRVHDHGPGLPAGEEEVIFEKFVQSSRTKTGAGGTGLGLAIAREIVRLHGGSLLAYNASSGGAVFELRLPACLNQPSKARSRAEWCCVEGSGIPTAVLISPEP